jgi:SPP1 family predicted phage head-tail adaptor
MDDILYLVHETKEQDEFGVWRVTKTLRQVFCQTNSITRAEFFSAGRNGLNPEFQFRIAAVDYQGERAVIYHDNQYAIYRTYNNNGDYMELYAQREGGTNERV